MRTSCIIALTSLIATVSTARAQEPMAMIGDKGVLKLGIIGCRENSDEDRFVKLMVDGDKAAAVAFAMDKGDSCTLMKAGDVVSVEDLSVWHEQSCLRPAGNPYCYWVPSKAVSKR